MIEIVIIYSSDEIKEGVIVKKDQSFIKRENTNLILDLIQEQKLISRSELAKLTRMSPTTISRNVSSLINMELVKETNEYTTGVGRRATKLMLNPYAAFSIGVALDENKLRFLLINLLGKPIAAKTIDKKYDKQPQAVITMIKEIIEQLLIENKINRNRITGICIAMPGIINHENGSVYKSAQLGWDNISFGEMLQKQIPYPIHVDNELNLRAYAEKTSSENRKTESIVVIGFGSGVGSALIEGDSIYRGAINAAGEIGHTVVTPNGALCTCGNFGCLQTYIAEVFLLEEASKHAPVKCIKDIVGYAESGEYWAANILDRAITYAAITVNNSVCVSNPNKVILTGSLIEESDYISKGIIKEAKRRLWSPLNDFLSIEVSNLKGDGVVLGAAMFSQREHINQLFYEKELL